MDINNNLITPIISAKDEYKIKNRKHQDKYFDRIKSMMTHNLLKDCIDIIGEYFIDDNLKIINTMTTSESSHIRDMCVHRGNVLIARNDGVYVYNNTRKKEIKKILLTYPIKKDDQDKYRIKIIPLSMAMDIEKQLLIVLFIVTSEFKKPYKFENIHIKRTYFIQIYDLINFKSIRQFEIKHIKSNNLNDENIIMRITLPFNSKNDDKLYNNSNSKELFLLNGEEKCITVIDIDSGFTLRKIDNKIGDIFEFTSPYNTPFFSQYDNDFFLTYYKNTKKTYINVVAKINSDGTKGNPTGCIINNYNICPKKYTLYAAFLSTYHKEIYTINIIAETATADILIYDMNGTYLEKIFTCEYPGSARCDSMCIFVTNNKVYLHIGESIIVLTRY